MRTHPLELDPRQVADLARSQLYHLLTWFRFPNPVIETFRAAMQTVWSIVCLQFVELALQLKLCFRYPSRDSAARGTILRILVLVN